MHGSTTPIASIVPLVTLIEGVPQHIDIELLQLDEETTQQFALLSSLGYNLRRVNSLQNTISRPPPAQKTRQFRHNTARLAPNARDTILSKNNTGTGATQKETPGNDLCVEWIPYMEKIGFKVIQVMRGKERIEVTASLCPLEINPMYGGVGNSIAVTWERVGASNASIHASEGLADRPACCGLTHWLVGYSVAHSLCCVASCPTLGLLLFTAHFAT